MAGEVDGVTPTVVSFVAPTFFTLQSVRYRQGELLASYGTGIHKHSCSQSRGRDNFQSALSTAAGRRKCRVYLTFGPC